MDAPEMAGAAGDQAAVRPPQYNVYASLWNMPILYMGLVESWTYQHDGSAVLYAEVVAAVFAIVVFAGAPVVTSRRAPALAA
jgi:hypothetical protein